ncbi:centromere protein W isoform X1 [Calonectris borealis]|uniref:centromere protein W isoform X1 n=1 Tax=Calonectris borealis TaxID=1323832 RepID=UPI003F4B8636
MMKRTAPRSTLRKIIKKHKPQLRLAANADLLVSQQEEDFVLPPSSPPGCFQKSNLHVDKSGTFELLTVSPSASRRSQDKRF